MRKKNHAPEEQVGGPPAGVGQFAGIDFARTEVREPARFKTYRIGLVVEVRARTQAEAVAEAVELLLPTARLDTMVL